MLITIFALSILMQQVDTPVLSLAQVTELKYPPIMRVARIHGDIELTAILKDGQILSISANKPDPTNARPIIRETSEKVLRSLNFWNKLSGSIKVKFTYKLLESSKTRFSRVLVDPDNNEITFEASLLSVD